MTDDTKPWFDRLIYGVIAAFVLVCFATPFALRAARDYLGWNPPAAVQRVIEWLPEVK